MKKRILLALVLGLVIALAIGGPALADHPPATHHHHITLPSGDCLEMPAIHKAGIKSPVLHHGGCS